MLFGYLLGNEVFRFEYFEKVTPTPAPILIKGTKGGQSVNKSFCQVF